MIHGLRRGSPFPDTKGATDTRLNGISRDDRAHSMNAIVGNRTLALMLVLFACTSLSCDTGWRLSSIVPRKKNFAWTDKPADAFLVPVNGWYYSAGNHHYVVLGYRVVVRPGTTPLLEYVVLCLEGHAHTATSAGELAEGFAVSMLIRSQENLGVVFGSLDAEHFFAERVSKRNIRVAYNGRTFFEPGRETSFDKYRKWLRFDVVARENKDRVVSIVGELQELLKQADIGGLDGCLPEIHKQGGTGSHLKY